MIPVVATLKSVTYQPGFAAPVVASTRQVAAFRSSASRSEYYQALAAGRMASAELEIAACEYNGENAIVIDEQEYAIIREYRPNAHKVILTIERR